MSKITSGNEDLDSFSFIGKREEITDLIDPSAYDDENFKAERVDKDGTHVPGTVIKFANATIKITKIDRKAKRTWGEHIALVASETVGSHHEHIVDSSSGAYEQHGAPYCEDCQVIVSEPSTEDGERKALDRQENELEDGTRID